MSKKTEYNFSYNEDNFVQCGDDMNELTVTITLCEYRSIIEERIRNEETINRLEDELKKSKENLSVFSKLLLLKSPEFIDKVCDAFRELFEQDKAINETEQGETDDNQNPL